VAARPCHTEARISVSDPLGRLVFLVHLEGSEAGWTKSPPVTACYKAEFSFYGVVDSPRRMVCPQDATPVTPPPTQPTPEIVISDGADKIVEQVLTAAAPTPRAEDLRGALAEALGRAAADAPPGRRPPAPQVVTDGSDIGVALAAPDDHSCLLGARIDGKVLCGARAGCRSSRASSPAPPGPRWPGRGRSPHIDTRPATLRLPWPGHEFWTRQGPGEAGRRSCCSLYLRGDIVLVRDRLRNKNLLQQDVELSSRVTRRTRR
jgi:hypothetical protein